MAEYQWDIFISHASEDKDVFVRPFALALQDAGYRVWYDEHTLILGDSLREKIDEGISNSRYGVVVLSPSFFAKPWPKRELDGLATLEARGTKVILPIWHDIDFDEVCKFSPILANRLAAPTKHGIPALVAAVSAAIERGDIQTSHRGEDAILKTQRSLRRDNLRESDPTETSSTLVGIREVAEARELTYGGRGFAAAVSCLKNTSNARLQWQVARRLVLGLRRGRSFMNRGALEAWAGPALTAWVRKDELFLSTLPGLHYGETHVLPVRLRVFVFAIEDQLIRLTKTLEFEGSAWEPIQGAAYDERFHGFYLDRFGADPCREAILEMLHEAGSHIEPPAIPNETQVRRFGLFLKQQKKQSQSADWDTDPLLVDPRIVPMWYGQSPSGHSVGVIKLQGSWSAQAINNLNECMWALLQRRARLIPYTWGVTRLVVVEPNRVSDRILACLQNCIDTQYPVPWRRPVNPLTKDFANEWFEPAHLVALSDKQWTEFNNNVCVPLSNVEQPNPGSDAGWSYSYRYGGLAQPDESLERKLIWGP